MTKLISLLAATLFSVSLWAQQPPPPPEGEHPKAQSPEGTKPVEPGRGPVKPHDSRHKSVKPKRPPVKPPVPEATAPDKPQEGL